MAIISKKISQKFSEHLLISIQKFPEIFQNFPKHIFEEIFSSRKKCQNFFRTPSSHVTPKGSSGYFGGGKCRKPAESVGKLCQILSVVLDQEKSQTFVANQSIEISRNFSNPDTPKMIIILEKPACYGHIWVPKKGPDTNFLIWFLLTHFEVFISYVSGM